TLQFAYTLSRSIDPATSFGGDLYTVSNPYDRAYDNGPSMADRTHIALVDFIYQAPFFRHASNRMVKTMLGGWQLSSIATMESGLPLNVTLGGSQGSNGLAQATNRPNFNGSLTYQETVASWFNPASFSLPGVGQWGTLGKGVVRGP